MNNHQIIAISLNCPRLWVDRALSIFSLLFHLEYLTLEQRFLLLDMLLQKANRSTPSKSEILTIWNRSPIEAWEDIDETIVAELVLGLGQDSVAEWIPLCLTELTGNQPKEPDPIEIQAVQEQLQPEPQDRSETKPSNAVHSLSEHVIEQRSSSALPHNTGIIF